LRSSTGLSVGGLVEGDVSGIRMLGGNHLTLSISVAQQQFSRPRRIHVFSTGPKL
jgi:hypothetical protein